MLFIFCCIYLIVLNCARFQSVVEVMQFRSDAICGCFCQFGMKLGSVNSSLAHTTIQQLCHLMSTATDVDSIKQHLIQVCNIVRHLYRGNDEICQVFRSLVTEWQLLMNSCIVTAYY